jgi:hypothetical protein
MKLRTNITQAKALYKSIVIGEAFDLYANIRLGQVLNIHPYIWLGQALNVHSNIPLLYDVELRTITQGKALTL